MEAPRLDSFELNKIARAYLGTLLFAMSLNVISGAIFSRPKQAWLFSSIDAGESGCRNRRGHAIHRAAQGTPFGQRVVHHFKTGSTMNDAAARLSGYPSTPIFT